MQIRGLVTTQGDVNSVQIKVYRVDVLQELHIVIVVMILP